jgi:hypothetical protein
MSTGQTGVNGKLKQVRRTNLVLTRKDWCEYNKTCYEDLNLNGNLCYHCKYKKYFDIPKLLNKLPKK